MLAPFVLRSCHWASTSSAYIETLKTLLSIAVYILTTRFWSVATGLVFESLVSTNQSSSPLLSLPVHRQWFRALFLTQIDPFDSKPEPRDNSRYSVLSEPNLPVHPTMLQPTTLTMANQKVLRPNDNILCRRTITYVLSNVLRLDERRGGLEQHKREQTDSPNQEDPEEVRMPAAVFFPKPQYVFTIYSPNTRESCG